MLCRHLGWGLRGICTSWPEVKGGAGQNCDTTCASRSGCSEDAWPGSEEQFKEVASQAGQTCETTQAGGAKQLGPRVTPGLHHLDSSNSSRLRAFFKGLARYDPSTDGHHCGWSGPDHVDDKESRCGATGDSGTYRCLAKDGGTFNVFKVNEAHIHASSLHWLQWCCLSRLPDRGFCPCNADREL